MDSLKRFPMRGANRKDKLENGQGLGAFHGDPSRSRDGGQGGGGASEFVQLQAAVVAIGVAATAAPLDGHKAGELTAPRGVAVKTTILCPPGNEGGDAQKTQELE